MIRARAAPVDRSIIYGSSGTILRGRIYRGFSDIGIEIELRSWRGWSARRASLRGTCDTLISASSGEVITLEIIAIRAGTLLPAMRWLKRKTFRDSGTAGA